MLAHYVSIEVMIRVGQMMVYNKVRILPWCCGLWGRVSQFPEEENWTRCVVP